MKENKKKRKRPTLSSVKKKTWEAFSRYIRTRDCIKTTGCPDWGLCCTCGKRYHIKLLQAGHFIAGRGNSILFDEVGTNAQCYNCNINLKGNTLAYRDFIVREYGEGEVERLRVLSGQAVKFTVVELKEKREIYKRREKDLRRNK